MCLAFVLLGCGAEMVTPLDAGDAGISMLEDAEPDAAQLEDAGDGGLDPPVLDAGSPLEDAGNDAGSDAGGLLEDAGVDSGPPPTPDAGPPDAGLVTDAGPGLPDAGSDAGTPDAGVVTVPDAGPPDAGPPDAGHDAGPPPCLPDTWEPNNAQASAALLATCRSNAGAWNIDRPTFHGPDADWYRIEVRRTTTRPTRVRASTPPGAMAWLRIRYVCDTGPPVACSGSRIGTTCETLGLGWAELTVSCPDPSGNATFYVEATRPSASACMYSPTLELEPG